MYISTYSHNHIYISTLFVYNVLGKKIIEDDGTKFVVKIWCKVCAKYKSEILRELNGSAKTAAIALLDGTENVKNSTVTINFLFQIFQA